MKSCFYDKLSSLCNKVQSAVLRCDEVFLAASGESSFRDTTEYLIKGTKYSLEIDEFPNVLSVSENICLKLRPVLKTFEVKTE